MTQQLPGFKDSVRTFWPVFFFTMGLIWSSSASYTRLQSVEARASQIESIQIARDKELIQALESLRICLSKIETSQAVLQSQINSMEKTVEKMDKR